jgi:hypothetical protein
MARLSPDAPQTADADWMMFPGGELEGKRPRVLCPACREQLSRDQLDSAAAHAVRPVHAAPKPICFQCYRAELERDRALKAAGQLETASDARFQCTLPFDPVNTVRLAALKAQRAAERQARGVPYADRRRQAQIAARHVLRVIGDGLRAQQTSASTRERSLGLLASSFEPLPGRAAERTMVAAIHAAELQLPESWLPFVVPG